MSLVVEPPLGRNASLQQASVRSPAPVDAPRLLRAKAAYTTRFLAERLDTGRDGYFLRGDEQTVPRAGDVVLARVMSIGKHTALESPVSRRQVLFPGDEILVAYGNRYAPDQFLAHVPTDLGQCHLAAAGGVAGMVSSRHASMEPPTVIAPVGLLADKDGVLTLGRLAPHQIPGEISPSPGSPPVVAVLGTSMNSGKTTALGCMVRGLTRAGLQVAAGKATGTGAGNDPRYYQDAGAARVLDFTDFGYPTTFRLEGNQVQGLLTALVHELTGPSTDIILIEIADGIYQEETRGLLFDQVFNQIVDTVMFTAADAAGAVAGVACLRDAGVPSIAAVSGLLTASPLAALEAECVLGGVPVRQTSSLQDPDVVRGLLSTILS